MVSPGLQRAWSASHGAGLSAPASPLRPLSVTADGTAVCLLRPLVGSALSSAGSPHLERSPMSFSSGAAGARGLTRIQRVIQ